MQVRDFDIDDLPQLETALAAHGAGASQTQIGGSGLFDVIITVILGSGGE